jgi:hypothetical protein
MKAADWSAAARRHLLPRFGPDWRLAGQVWVVGGPMEWLAARSLRNHRRTTTDSGSAHR